jgi:hypothetical protein
MTNKDLTGENASTIVEVTLDLVLQNLIFI